MLQVNRRPGGAAGRPGRQVGPEGQLARYPRTDCHCPRHRPLYPRGRLEARRQGSLARADRLLHCAVRPVEPAQVAPDPRGRGGRRLPAVLWLRIGPRGRGPSPGQRADRLGAGRDGRRAAPWTPWRWRPRAAGPP